MSGERLNDSTRHLSAGVYLDAAYRDRLIRDVYLDRARRVAPSYGFALEPVLTPIFTQRIGPHSRAH